jgi:hypothetical protein
MRPDDDVTIQRSAYDRLKALGQMAQYSEVQLAEREAQARTVSPEERRLAIGYVSELSEAQRRVLALKRKRAKFARKANRRRR